MPTLKEIKKNLPEDTPERRAEVLRSLQESLARNREAIYRHAEKEQTAILEELDSLEKALKADGLTALIQNDPKEVYQALELLADHPSDEVREAALKTLRALQNAGRGRNLAKLGEVVPVNTYQEVREVKRAIVEAPLGRNWEEIPGDAALFHSSPDDASFQTRFDGKPLLQWWDMSLSYSSLRSFLSEMGPDAALCLDLCLYVAVKDDRVPIETDEIIRGLGWDPRTTEARRKMRRKVWGWVTAFASMSVIGIRPGKPERWKDKLTGKTLDLRTRGPLILIGSTSSPEGQLTLDGSDAPIKFTVVPGDWLAKFRGNRQVLASLGNTWKIASIPGGKPSGAWARAYAAVLLQSWREKAAYDSPTFTREGLHLACPSEPSLWDVLDGSNPRRAIEYDREAWALLKEAGIIATDPKKLDFTPRHKEKRQGWRTDFLSEELTVRPGPDIEAQVSEVRPLGSRKRKA
jgi:hypothetical protein